MNLWTSIIMMIVGKVMANFIAVNSKIERSKINEAIMVLILIIGMGLYIIGGVKALLILKPLLETIK